MMPNDPTMSHDALDAVIAGYMLAVEAGDVPNRQELLERHPEHADALRAFFVDLDRMDRVASPLRLADNLEATGAADTNGQTVSPTVRYFGDYELLEEIARGGMGIVYKARQVSLNRLVALKMILAGGFASSREIRRFRAEAEAAANLDHPHIVPIYEVGEHEGQQYYSMKFIEGSSLAGRPRGDLRKEVDGLISVARAVHHAHQHGVLHRDLKPSNVLVDPQGSWFVTDFGLAKRLAGADRSLTESGQILGTPRYMAPEQAAGRKDLTVVADVYSLGVIFYERLTGRTPFAGDDVLTLLRQVRESEPPRPSSILPGLNRDLETVVLKCLDKDPAHRYLGAEALADDLDRWLAGKPITARPSGSLARAWKWARRNPTVAALAASVSVLLVALLIGSMVTALRLAAAAWSSQGLYLAAQSELVRPTNPGLALVLALEGAERHASPIAHNAVLAAMEANDELRTLIGPGGKVTMIAVAPDGRTVVTGSDDRTARLWDLDSGRLLAALDHDAPLVALRFAPDGRRLVTFSSGYADLEGGVWSTDDRMPPRGVPTVRVWDAATGRRLAEWSEAVGGQTVFRLNPAGAMDLSRDGQRLVVTSGGFPGHPPRIIDLARGKVHAELNGHDGPVYSVALSPDGRRVATASADRTVRIWDAKTGTERHRLAGRRCDVWFVAFSPDGRRLLTLGSQAVFTFEFTPTGVRSSVRSESTTTHENVVGRLWDAETGAELIGLPWPREQTGPARRARFYPDGRRILTILSGSGWSIIGDDPLHPAIWEADRGQLLASLRRDESNAPPEARRTSDLAISPDGQRLAIAYEDGLVRLLSPSGTPLKALSGHTGAVRALAFTPDGRRLVSASDDGTARVWDTRIGEEADRARGRWPEAQFVVYSPDGRIVAAAMGPVIAFRDAATGRELARTDPLRNRTYPNQPPLFSPDGRALLVNSGGVLTLFDTASGRRSWTIGRMSGHHLRMAFSPDGRTVAFADGDGHLIEAATGRERFKLIATFPSDVLPIRRAGFPDYPVRDIGFSPDGTMVVTSWGPSGAGRGPSIGDPLALLWDARDGRQLAVLTDSGAAGGPLVLEAVFSPDGRRLATASAGSEVRIWDVATGRVRVVLRGHGGSVHSVAFAADGRRVLTASGDGTARIWDAERGRELARLVGHEGSVRSAAFSPDGAVILTYGDDRTARLWDGADGRPLCNLVHHPQGIRSAGFRPDGRVVVVSLEGQPALTRTWPVDFLAAARARCPRELTAAERTRFELPTP
jgi:WD40 repeat protein